MFSSFGGISRLSRAFSHLPQQNRFFAATSTAVKDGANANNSNANIQTDIKSDLQLLSSLRIGDQVRKNRVVMAPIRSGSADLAAFGRLYIPNPDLVERFANDCPLTEDAPPEVWFSHKDEKGYADFPAYCPDTKESTKDVDRPLSTTAAEISTFEAEMLTSDQSGVNDQMLQMLLPSATNRHVARSHLVLSSKAGLKRNKFWRQSMEADVHVYDFQDGCPPGEAPNVFKSLENAHRTFPGKVASVRVSDFDVPDATETISAEIRACVKQRQVRWFMLPMCDDRHHVQEYIDMIDAVDPDWLASHGRLQIICETPKCLHNIDDILMAHPMVTGVVIGGGDYSRFVFAEPDVIVRHLRWDVLNACLRHQRFPIDGPSLGIGKDAANRHYTASEAAGLRSSVVLHPSQVEAANVTFTPDQAYVKEVRPHVEEWNRSRRTGYKVGSGADFVGPPHLKQMKWFLNYDGLVRSGQSTFCQPVHKNLVPRVTAFVDKKLTQALELKPNPVVPFLALGMKAHPDHSRLLANIGFSNCGFADGFGRASPQDVDAVQTHIQHRRTTSSGKEIVTYGVELLDDKHQKIFSFTRKFLEEPIVVRNKSNNAASEPSAERLTHVEDALARIGSRVLELDTLKAPSLALNSEYCALFGLDAVLHHTASPTLPSTLHLYCHLLPPSLTALEDVTFHRPMKADQNYTVSHHHDLRKEGGRVSVVQDSDGQILSTAFFQADDATGADEPWSEREATTGLQMGYQLL